MSRGAPLPFGKRRKYRAGDGPAATGEQDVGPLVTQRSAANCQRLYFEWCQSGQPQDVLARLKRRFGETWNATVTAAARIDITRGYAEIARELKAKVLQLDNQIASIIDPDFDPEGPMATLFQSTACVGSLVRLKRYWSDASREPIHRVLIKLIADASKLVGTRVTRDDVSIFMISSIAGGGKTEALNGLADFATHGWDHDLMTYGAHHLIPQDLVDPINVAMPSSRPRVTAVVVLAATFNDTTSFIYSKAKDTPRDVTNRVIWRMLMNFDIRRVEEFQHTDFEDFNQLTEAARGLVGIDPRQVVVLLTVDDLMKIEEPAVRTSLFTALASCMRTDFMAGYPTFVIVSSLQVEPMLTEISIGCGYQVTNVPLPSLSSTVATEIKQQLKDEITQRCSPPALGMQIARSACVTVDICSGHFRSLHGVIKHYSQSIALTPGVPAGLFPKVIDTQEKFNVAFYVLAVRIATGNPLRGRWIPDERILRMLLEGHIQFTVHDMTTIDYTVVAARWLLSDVNQQWRPLRQALRQSLYLSISGNQTMPKTWTCGMLAVMFFRAVACQWVSVRGIYDLQDFGIPADAKVNDVSLKHVFGDAIYEPKLQRSSNVTFFPWKSRPADGLADYIVVNDLLHIKSEELLFCPENIHKIPTPRPNVLFTVGSNPCHIAIEALSDRFCQRDGTPITLLFQNKLWEPISVDLLQRWITRMHTYAQHIPPHGLGLAKGTYLNILFVTGVTTLGPATSLNDCEGTAILPPEALSNMLEPFDTMMLMERAIDASGRSDLTHGD